MDKIQSFLIILSIVPFFGVRLFFNILVYNSINNSNVIPFFHFQREGINAHVYCIFVYKWIIYESDSGLIKNQKSFCNKVSFYSLIISIVSVVALSLLNIFFI